MVPKFYLVDISLDIILYFYCSNCNKFWIFLCREHAPSIIFMDEIDSIGSARMESGSGNGDSEVQRTMLELLNQLDGFEASNKIKVQCINAICNEAFKPDIGFRLKLVSIRSAVLQVLMATNRIDILDQALLRPGRIDRKIEFPNPNEDVSTTTCFGIYSCYLELTIATR